ncbi:part of a binding-protein-dependent transport system [Arthrobacter sp. Hiyo8]|nr:part of a binding-protein-dependent transport system [Arthrobacter sp. Hiyo8]
MTTQTVHEPSTAARPAGRPATSRPRRSRAQRGRWTLTTVLALCSLTVLVPLYVTVSMAFKTTAQAVDGNAFSLPGLGAWTALPRPGP